MIKKGIIITIFVLGMMVPVSFVDAGTVLSAYKYAWSNNVGYINFENVIVGDSTLTGYAWSENTGWINFSPAQGGVFNDGNGHLSGYAWGEGLGWIDFSGVSISTSTGRFSGSATGENVGTINFNCPTYCDVRTDWSATTTSVITEPASTSRSGSRVRGGGVIGQFYTPAHVESYNEPLSVLPEQSGTITQDTPAGLVTVNIPANDLDDRTIFVIEAIPLAVNNSYLVKDGRELSDALFYDVYAMTESGVLVHNFSRPITITLPISDPNVINGNPKLYWLNETNWQWVQIPEAIFTANSVKFSVSHLTKFAIFFSPKSIIEKGGGAIVLPVDKKQQYLASSSMISVPVSGTSTPKISNRSGLIIYALFLFGLFWIILGKKRRNKDDCDSCNF